MVEANMTRTLLVTGASRGIGAAVALKAARAGWVVCLNYRTQREETMALVETIAALFAEIDRKLPPLGCLVNNAARIAPRRMRLCEMDAAEISGLLAVNVAGAMVAAREAVRRMSIAEGGSGGAIVNVSSLAARHGAPNMYVHYAASKGALDAFTHGLAIEVAGEGIRVNAVRPGLIDTEVHARSGMAERIAKLGPRLPMGRAGTPDEVAAAILWLASEEASYVTGAILDVGGGA